MENGILDETAALATALERGDVTAAGELYTDDARLLAASAQSLHGRREIEAYWRAGIELGLSSISFETRVLEKIDGGTLELGRYVVSLESGSTPAVEQGAYVVLHTQTDDGSWRRAVEVFDPDGPASARRNVCKEEP
jgi:ketosteroid isomerase-like protein